MLATDTIVRALVSPAHGCPCCTSALSISQLGYVAGMYVSARRAMETPGPMPAGVFDLIPMPRHRVE